MLHSYRSGHRLLSQWLREAAIAARPKARDATVSTVADFAIEYTNAISAIATAEYVAHTRRIAEAQGDLNTELLSILLAGYDESDLRVAELLKRAGYLEQRQTYCLVLVQSAQAAEMAQRPRAERILAALNDALADLPIRSLAGIRQHRVVALLSAKRRQSGWTAPQADLALRLTPKLATLGPAVLVGVSADHPSTAFIPKAMTEAALALDLASVGRRVVRFPDLTVRDLLVHHGTAHIHAAPPIWIAQLFTADQKLAGELLATLRALADSDMNVQAAARALGRHPNTITGRLQRIRDLTGRDGQRYHELTELLLAADCWRGRDSP
jgi:sugar diacid utilization regulator